MGRVTPLVCLAGPRGSELPSPTTRRGLFSDVGDLSRSQLTGTVSFRSLLSVGARAVLRAAPFRLGSRKRCARIVFRKRTFFLLVCGVCLATSANSLPCAAVAALIDSLCSFFFTASAPRTGCLCLRSRSLGATSMRCGFGGCRLISLGPAEAAFNFRSVTVDQGLCCSGC